MSGSDVRHVNTEFGRLAVPTSLLALWNKAGWPTDETLKQMAAEQEAHRTPAADGSE